MPIQLVVQEIESLSASGAYGGTRFLSPETEVIITSLDLFRSQFRYINDNGQPLTPEQRDTVDAWVGRAISEIMTPVVEIGTLRWSMEKPNSVLVDEGWIFADGRTVLRGEYPELWDKAQLWRLINPDRIQIPNLVGRYASGMLASAQNPESWGENSVQLSISEMPSHTHSYTRATITAVTYTPTPSPATFVSNFNTQTGAAGGNQPHENRPASTGLFPYIVGR